MNKKILISLSVIGVVAAVAIGGTIAYFNDTETSAGNIFVAGTIDLKVDHTKETYNNIDCKTCGVTIKSDTSNIVTGTVGGDDSVGFPHAAKQVSNPHSAWTVTGDIPEATWIWATDPTTPHDSGNINVTYSFQNKFDWMGPVTGITLTLGVGADNEFAVYLNGNLVGADASEYNYQTPAKTYSGFGSFLVQGSNTLRIDVTNMAQPGGTPGSNPAGLLYKLVINGNCDNDYFKNNCTLWALKDLGTEDHFWKFNDVKPGDRGTNVISLHVDSNDSYICMLVKNKQNIENGLTGPEIALRDSEPTGELSQYINLVVWKDSNGNGLYETTEGTALYNGAFDLLPTIGKLSIPANGSDNLGIAWCFGTQTINGDGTISCNGSGNQNIAQTDKLIADIVLYATQQRNNENFTCASVQLP